MNMLILKILLILSNVFSESGFLCAYQEILQMKSEIRRTSSA